MPVPEKILKAKQTPGIYACKARAEMLFIETDAAGNVYQLRPRDFSRDGDLSDEGWNPCEAPQSMQVFRLEQI